MQQILVVGGAPGATTKVTSSNTASALSNSVLYRDGSSSNDNNSNLAKYVLITVEDNPIRWAVGGATPTTVLGHKLLPGGSIRLDSFASIKDFKYINAVSGANATLQITPEF